MKNLLLCPQKSIKLFLANRRPFLQLSLIIASIGLVFDLLIQFFPDIFSGPIFSILILIAEILSVSIFHIALFRLIKNRLANNNSKIKEIINESKKRYRDYIYISLILFVIIFAGLILFVIPGIIFAIWYFAAGYLVATEELKPMAALDLSKRRVTGNFSSILLKFLFGLLLFPLPLVIVLSILTGLGDQSSLLMAILGIVANFLAVLIITPYFYSLTALIYEELKN